MQPLNIDRFEQLPGGTLSDRTALSLAKSVTVEPIKPIQYLQILRNYKWILLGCLLAGGGLTALLVWKTPYVYQASALMEIQGINENLLNSKELNPSARTDTSSQSYINTEAKILQTEPVAVRAATRLNNAQKSDSRNPPYTAAEIDRSIRARAHEDDRILELWAESADPVRAASIANAVATAFVDLDLESRLTEAQKTSHWLTAQLHDLSEKLRRSEEDLQTFVIANHLLVDREEGSVAEDGLRRVQDELARARAERIAKQSVYDIVKANPAEIGTGALQDSTLQQYEVQLTTLRRDLADLEAVYAPDYFKVKRDKAQIASLQEAYDKQRKIAVKHIEDDFHAASVQEKMLDDQYLLQFKETANQTANMVKFRELKSALDLNRTIYADILQRVKGYGVASAMQTSNIRIVQQAALPRYPVRPNKALLVIVGGIGTLCLGSVIVLISAARARNIEGPGEAQLYLHTPELGVIPRLAVHEARRSARYLSTGTGDSSVIARDHYSSPTSESFRSISASILLPDFGGNGPRVLLVTSLNPGDGKTTVASNLAVSLAGISRRVLLIDGDRRRGRLHELFGRPNDNGLSNLLLGDTPEGTQDFIVETSVPYLYLLPNGTATLPTADLFYSDRMRQLIAACRTEFDMIVIDTPPVLHLPDARIIGRLSDGVVLVLRAGRVRPESVVAAELRLRNDGVRILGTVLNDWNPRTNGYGVYPKHYARTGTA